jgi:hypothetical protein
METSDVIIICCNETTSYGWDFPSKDDFVLLTKYAFVVEYVHSKYLVYNSFMLQLLMYFNLFVIKKSDGFYQKSFQEVLVYQKAIGAHSDPFSFEGLPNEYKYVYYLYILY